MAKKSGERGRAIEVLLETNYTKYYPHYFCYCSLNEFSAIEEVGQHASSLRGVGAVWNF